MNGDRVALDTNQVIQVLNNTNNIGQTILKFSVICLPIPVVGELHYGALNSQRVQQNLERMKQLIDRCEVLSIERSTAEIYATIRLQLKQDGRPIPENDLWIAAICLEHQLPLATSDEHFEWVNGLTLIRL